MVESLILRLLALRALVALSAALLLLATLIGDVWAGEPMPQAGAGFTVDPANIDDEVEEVDSEQVDSLLHVLMKDDGSLASYVTEAMRWRLSVEAQGGQALGLENFYFTVRPKGSPLTENCGGDAFCPAGYSAAGSSNLINLEAPRISTTSGGETYFRRAFTLIMPLDLTWVGFYDDLRYRVEQACMVADERRQTRGDGLDESRSAPLDAHLGDYGLVATVFRDQGAWAETDLVVAVKCWPASHTLKSLKARLNP